MRTRLFVISSLAVAAVIGASSATAAVANPKGPGDVTPKSTTTTAAPKGPDKVAPKPTPTTQPPKGPGDVAQPPKGGDPEPQPKPNGPGDIANPPNKPVVDPAPNDNGGSDVDYGTTMGDDEAPVDGVVSDGLVARRAGSGGAVVAPAPPAADDANATATPAESQGSSHMPVFVVAFVAALVAGLLALFAARVRRHDEDAPSA